MKVRIEDKDALQALSWEALKDYLDRAKGWKYAEDIPGKAAVYQHKDKSGRLSEIVVPIRRDFADYARRMADAVSTLAHVENRSELDVYDDLSGSGEAAARKVHARIRKWLAEEGWHVDDVSKPDWPFSIIVKVEGGQTVDIFQHRACVDRITVAQQWSFDEEFSEQFAKLPDHVQRDAIYDIYRDVFISGLDLARLGIPPREMRYGAFMYYDGVTKDALMQKILLVVRMHALTMRTFGRAFAEAGHSSESTSRLLHLVPTAGPSALAG